MTAIPTNRTTANSPSEHVSDHNILHHFNNEHPTDPSAHIGTYDFYDPTVTIARDTVGNITSMVESGLTTTFSYDVTGQLTTYVRNGVTRTVTRDTAGNVTGVS